MHDLDLMMLSDLYFLALPTHRFECRALILQLAEEDIRKVSQLDKSSTGRSGFEKFRNTFQGFVIMITLPDLAKIPIKVMSPVQYRFMRL